MKTSTPNGYRRIGRFAAYGSAGTAIAIALLMAASPMAGALKPHVILPPYKGTAASLSKYSYTSGNCKTSSALTAFHWIPKTGNVTGFVYAAAKGCTVVPTGYGNAYVSQQGTLQIAIPVKVYTNGAHNFSINWSYAVTIIASVSGAVGGCPVAKAPGSYNDCFVEAGASTSAGIQDLYDQTNNSYLYGGYGGHAQVPGPQNYSYVQNYSYCTTGGACYVYNYTGFCGQYKYYYYNCVPSGTQAAGTNVTWVNTGNHCEDMFNNHCYYWQNWTLNASHKFWILADVYYSAYGYIAGYSGAHTATASANGATLGNTGWKIASVTVT